MQWTVVVPAKSLPAAKSRLSAATSGPKAHRALVEAIRRDTFEAVAAADAVGRVVVVTDARPHEDDAFAAFEHLLIQHSAGLNGAVRDGVDHARSQWRHDGVAALVGDLPALRAADLARALDAARQAPAGFVPDAAGTGTTLLTALPGQPLTPRFGPESAQRHAEQAVRLTAADSLRCDVDTLADLAAAAILGLGPHTARIWAVLDAPSLPGVHDGVA